MHMHACTYYSLRARHVFLAFLISNSSLQYPTRISKYKTVFKSMNTVSLIVTALR